MENMYLSHNAPWVEANLVTFIFLTVELHTELKYPYIGLQSRCIMGYMQIYGIFFPSQKCYLYYVMDVCV